MSLFLDENNGSATDDDEWSERSEHWLSGFPTGSRPRGRRERRAEPLILCGHGVTMRIDNGALIIRDGFTHYPQKDVTHRFFKGDLALPPRIVMIDGSGSITFDVLAWLAEQRVALILLNWKGEAVSVLSATGYSADQRKVAWQEDTRRDQAKRLAFCASLVRDKLTASIETLENVVPASTARAKAVAKARAGRCRLSDAKLADLTAVRLIEAQCASAYFAAWRHLKIDWIATGRRPIPDDWRGFGSRTSLANNGKLLNINASHPVNAMLNYAYGALEGRLRVKAAADGYDPTMGVMHHGRRGKSAFVFDLMEPERPKVDAAVIAFLATNKLSSADFVVREDGVCRLSPQLARRVCELVETASSKV